MAKGSSSNILWTDNELTSAVDAYVFMLRAQRAGLSYPVDMGAGVLLSGSLVTRNDASLRYRMRNISAVVREMGGPLLAEYSPAEQVGTNVRQRLRAILADHEPFRTIVEETDALPSKPASTNARTEALDRLAKLRLQISELERELIGIGHNRPPEPLSSDGPNRADFEQARENVQALEDEVRKAEPDPEVARARASLLLKFGLKVAIWVGERATKFTDVTLKFLAPVVVAKATGLAPVLIDALRAVSRAISF